jgi:hypothetical protein
MYACPNCGEDTFSFWAKWAASDLTPRSCSRCGEKATSKVWPVLLVAGLSLAVAFFAVLASVRWKKPDFMLAFPVFALLSVPVAVHFAQLVPATEQRTRVAHLCYWLTAAGVAAWFGWRVFAHVQAA